MSEQKPSLEAILDEYSPDNEEPKTRVGRVDAQKIINSTVESPDIVEKAKSRPPVSHEKSALFDNALRSDTPADDVKPADLSRHKIAVVSSDAMSEIRTNLNDCLMALKNSTFISQQGLESTARRALVSVMILIIIQTILIVAMIWLNTNLGITPVLKAVEHIKRDERIPIIGSSEFRYLAGEYNVMYNAYKNSISRLNFKASHDELTGAYNRAGYEVIKNNIDMTTTAMMIIDADKFKQINDTYGHKTGDKVLKRVANTLKRSFRSDDYVCRIGGDEFLVLMVHVVGDPKTLIENKMRSINEDLCRVEDDVPAISLSVGVAYCDEGLAPDVLFHRADTALYFVKENGRNGCRFYSDDLEELAARKLTSISETDK